MYVCANASRRWVALVAMTLFVFQALIASTAVAAAGLASGAGTTTTIICTASGPRVVTVGAESKAQGRHQQHSGALPHCCTAGCAFLSGLVLPELFFLAWFVPAATYVAPPPVVDTPFSSALARSQQRTRAPPLAA
ncbi:DUF2946 family protein [Achromobacter kerstersii]|uniref:DUF2946 family protein n=1 Tax=Achromobacter kerstersii TaxID=1353890 RepID=UPI001581AC83|nr:DUF2946 family protein [Achromobacter kerstersii]